MSALSADEGDSASTAAPAQGANPLHHPAAGPPPRAGEESARPPLPQRPADLRLRHPVLLGCADDDDGDAHHRADPWPRLYLHGLVRAADGQKMSKSKGNVVDPLGLIDQYGADALRFFMAAMESQGRDIKMDETRVEGYRNFATKLWNATRFCQANGIGASQTLAAPAATLAANKWIIGEVVETWPSSTRRWPTCASMPPPTRSTTSCGTGSATGISN